MSHPATTQTRLAHEIIKPTIGSRVLNRKEELLSGELATEIRELLEQRGVLVFPEISFTDEEQVAFTKTLGTFERERQGGTGGRDAGRYGLRVDFCLQCGVVHKVLSKCPTEIGQRVAVIGLGRENVYLLEGARGHGWPHQLCPLH